MSTRPASAAISATSTATFMPWLNRYRTFAAMPWALGTPRPSESSPLRACVQVSTVTPARLRCARSASSIVQPSLA
jgi:hypothetical protein